MGRPATNIPGNTVTFSTRNMRRSHRDKLRAYGAVLEKNMEEMLDYCLKLGLRQIEADFERDAVPFDPTRERRKA